MRQGKFSINARDWRRLRDRAKQAQKRGQSEVCGALLADSNRNLELVFLPNSSSKAGSFLISSEDICSAKATAKETNRRLSGFFHSHPISEAIPGKKDINDAP